MSLSAIVTDVVVGDATSIPHNHGDWMMRLYAAGRFGKIDLNPKNKGSFFTAWYLHSGRNSHAPSAGRCANYLNEKQTNNTTGVLCLYSKAWLKVKVKKLVGDVVLDQGSSLIFMLLKSITCQLIWTFLKLFFHLNLTCHWPPLVWHYRSRFLSCYSVMTDLQ